MAWQHDPHFLIRNPGRRRFLIGALGFGVALTRASRVFAAEFWNTKDPSAWTEEEIIALTSKSPWARLAAPQVKHTDDPTGNAGIPQRGVGSIPIIVRWESAQPILDALKGAVPAEFGGHYVLSVTNFPERPHRGRGDQSDAAEELARLQNGATLQAKGKNPVEAGIIRRQHSSILFGFAKDLLPLTAGDRDILFVLDTDLLTIKVKFDAKDMLYRGKLAV
jgi:hypothetical protein